MKYDMSFIHTAKVHIQTFADLVTELSPRLNVSHIVDESLLEYAQNHAVDQNLEGKLDRHIETLSKQSELIVVTCSSIGAIAEKLSSLYGCPVLRIDRAMADYAVTHGDNILVLAALESTLSPTLELLNGSACNHHCSPNITLFHIKNCWAHFLSGDMQKYQQAIIKAIIDKEAKYDLVVLAQASMAQVEGKMDLSVPILSSPRIGMKHAIAQLIK